jgi:hypothetical protein
MELLISMQRIHLEKKRKTKNQNVREKIPNSTLSTTPHHVERISGRICSREEEAIVFVSMFETIRQSYK